MSREDTWKVQILELKVKIHCHGCLKSVKKVLRNIDGVYESTVDAASGKVTVSGVMDPDTVMKKLRKARKPAQLWGAENNPAVVTQVQNLQLGGGDGENNGQQQANDTGIEDLQLPNAGAGGAMQADMVVPLPMPSLEAANDPNTNNEDVKANGLDDDDDDIHNMLMKRLGMPSAIVGGDEEGGGGNGTGNGGGNTNNGSGKKEGQVNENGGSSQQLPQNGTGAGAGGAIALGSGNQPGQNQKNPGPGKKRGGPSGAGRLGRPMIRGEMPPQEAGMMMRPLNMMDADVEGLPGMGQQIGGRGTLVGGMPMAQPHMGGAAMQQGGAVPVHGRPAAGGMPTAAGFITGVGGVGGMLASPEMLPMPQQLMPPPPPPEQDMAAVMQHQQPMVMKGYDDHGQHDHGSYQQPMMMKGYGDHGQHDHGGYGYPPPPASNYGYGYGLPAMPQYPLAYNYPMPQQHHHDNIFSDENPDASCSVM